MPPKPRILGGPVSWPWRPILVAIVLLCLSACTDYDLLDGAIYSPRPMPEANGPQGRDPVEQLVPRFTPPDPVP
jgi:hypothetical protein